jgi:hypothetical protein
MSAIKKISARAKQIHRMHPGKLWKFCILQASQEYRAGKLGPAKRKVSKRKKTVKRKKSLYKRRPVIATERRVSGVLSMLHAKSAVRQLIKKKVDNLVLRKYHAGKKSVKRKLQRALAAAKRELNKYA